MSAFVVVDKKSLNEVKVDESKIILNAASEVHTHLYRADVAEFIQDGNDLILKLKSGKTIVIVNFFLKHEDEESDLLFEDEDCGLPWLPLLLGGGAGVAGAAAIVDSNKGDKDNNHAPTANDHIQPVITAEDSAVTGKISGITDKDGDELTYKLGEAPANGTVIIDEKTGEYTYTPNNDFRVC